jgi:hypothetical protein
MFGRKDKSAIQAWADALKSNSSLVELNLAKNGMRGDDVKIFADGIRDNGALFRNIMASKKDVPTSELEGLPASGRKGLKCTYEGREVTVIKAWKNGTNDIAWVDRVEPKAKGGVNEAHVWWQAGGYYDHGDDRGQFQWEA